MAECKTTCSSWYEQAVNLCCVKPLQPGSCYSIVYLMLISMFLGVIHWGVWRLLDSICLNSWDSLRAYDFHFIREGTERFGENWLRLQSKFGTIAKWDPADSLRLYRFIFSICISVQPIKLTMRPFILATNKMLNWVFLSSVCHSLKHDFILWYNRQYSIQVPNFQPRDLSIRL